MVHGDETISAIHGSAGEEAPDLGAWIEDHEEADKLKVYADAAALSRGDLAPLVKVAKRHRIDIDIQLRDDG